MPPPLWFMLVSCAFLVGGCIGWLRSDDPYWRTEPAVRVKPLPHHFSKYPDGLSLRFAMMHDMIHERFPKHSQAYYEERNRVVRRQLAALEDAKDEGALRRRDELLDDLGAGLERLGRHEEAVALMRKKLQDQLDRRVSGRALYGSYANLGTFLILWQLQEGFADKAKAKERLQEGLGYIHKSIEVNPEAHFGREIWQAVILEFLIAALDDPQLLTRFDFIGNRLDWMVDGRRRSFDPSWVRGYTGDRAGADRFITRVGAEESWSLVKTSQPMPTPFDEPTLGIIGMWRLGSGANPYFALALGEIALRIGQRYIAWNAFERAASMAGGIWPDPDIQEKILAHCRARQRAIEETVPEPAEVLRNSFNDELAFGQRYQRAYQDYEADRIAQGVSIDDPDFYKGFRFEIENGPIASPVGPEDWLQVTTARRLPTVSAPAVLYFSGLAAFFTAGVLVLLDRFLLSHPSPSE